MKVLFFDPIAKLGDLQIPALLKLQAGGFRIVGVSESAREGEDRDERVSLLRSQGVVFERLFICSKPNLGELQPWQVETPIDRTMSLLVKSAESDNVFAQNLGVELVSLGETSWMDLAKKCLRRHRTGRAARRTRETEISAFVDLDGDGRCKAHTGIGYFDHMLEQISKHARFDLTLEAKGDLEVDEHHTIEDVAIVLGEALNRALGDRFGIERFGFLLPMDETEAKVSLDLSGRPFLKFQGSFSREFVGGMPTEMVPHFFRSLAESLRATLHIEVTGENAHHMVEASFKCFGRALGGAIACSDKSGMPSTKGAL